MSQKSLSTWKNKIVYWGLSLIFVVKFGKFVALEILDAVGPLLTQVL
jgi:hypothetical protein